MTKASVPTRALREASLFNLAYPKTLLSDQQQNPSKKPIIIVLKRNLLSVNSVLKQNLLKQLRRQ